MARVLIVGCGCRGRAVARALRADGHSVRGTTRDPGRRGELAGDGIDPWLGDPDRVGSLVSALDGVAVLCWLLGSAAGPPDAVAALHGPRLEAMLARVVETTVRGVVYEAAGSAPAEVLAAGAAIVRAAHETWRIPVEHLHADPADHPVWLAGARGAIDRLIFTSG